MLLKSRFPSQLVDAYCERITPDEQYSLVWLEGVASVLFGVAAFSTFYVIVVWMLSYAMAFAGIWRIERASRKPSLVQYGIVVLRVYFCRIAEKWFALWANEQCRAETLTAQTFTHPSPLICNAGNFVIGFPLLEVFYN